MVISGTLLTFSVLRWLHHLTNSLPSVPLISLVLGLLPGLMLLAVWLFGINRYGAPWRTLGLLPPRQRRYLFLPWVVLALSLTFAAAYYLVVTAVGIEVLVPEPLPAWVLGDGLYRLFNAVSLGIVGPLAEELFFRGFLLAAPLAYRLGKPLVPVRKQGKLPFDTAIAEYDLEYGTDAVEVHIDGISSGQRVLVVDDLLATGGTLAATVDLIERTGGRVEGLAVLVELTELNGRERLQGYDLLSLIAF